MGNIKSITYVGKTQTYDLEIDHTDHQYYLSNGMLTSNSHAVVYSMVGFHTAYLKAHYPLEFLTANLISENNSNAKKSAGNILKYKDEIRNLGTKIVPPDINKSEMTYKIIDSNTLITGFNALKFMGKNAIPEIIEKRPFSSFEDFLTKIDHSKVNAPSIQALAASGALDSFGMTRRQMYLYTADFKKKFSVHLKKKNPTKSFSYPWPNEPEWTTPEKFAMEKCYLGEGLSGNVYQLYPRFFSTKAIHFQDLATLYPDSSENHKRMLLDKDGTVECIIQDVFQFKVKKENSKIFGEMITKLKLQDPYGGSISMTLFPSNLTHVKKRLKELGGKIGLEQGVALQLAVKVDWYEGSIGLIYENIKKVHLPPQEPFDLEHHKVSMKVEKKAKTKSTTADPEEILEEIEEEIIEEGDYDEPLET